MRNNEFMKIVTLSTIQGNQALLELSQKSISEAKSMKAITIVALVHVPASFVAVSLYSSSQYQAWLKSDRISFRWATSPQHSKIVSQYQLQRYCWSMQSLRSHLCS